VVAVHDDPAFNHGIGKHFFPTAIDVVGLFPNCYQKTRSGVRDSDPAYVRINDIENHLASISGWTVKWTIEGVGDMPITG
jgi:hypothetical protein